MHTNNSASPAKCCATCDAWAPLPDEQQPPGQPRQGICHLNPPQQVLLGMGQAPGRIALNGAAGNVPMFFSREAVSTEHYWCRHWLLAPDSAGLVKDDSIKTA